MYIVPITPMEKMDFSKVENVCHNLNKDWPRWNGVDRTGAVNQTGQVRS